MHGTHNAWMSVYSVGISIVRLPQFNIGNIFQIEFLASWQRGNNQVLKLGNLGLSTSVTQRILENIVGIFAKSTNRRLYILLSQNLAYIAWHKAVTSHHIGLKPDTHSILCAPDFHLPDSIYAHDGRSKVVVEIVAKKILVVSTIWTFQGYNSQLSRLLLFGGNAKLKHLCWQLCLRLNDAVLHINRSHIGIGALLEENRYACRTIACRRGHIGHTFHTVYRFFQWHNHAFVYGFSTCPRIRSPHIYCRRSNVGIFLHWQCRERNCPQRHNENTDDD